MLMVRGTRPNGEPVPSFLFRIAEMWIYDFLNEGEQNELEAMLPTAREDELLSWVRGHGGIPQFVGLVYVEPDTCPGCGSVFCNDWEACIRRGRDQEPIVVDDNELPF